jgi:hypothetical protein
MKKCFRCGYYTENLTSMSSGQSGEGTVDVCLICVRVAEQPGEFSEITMAKICVALNVILDVLKETFKVNEGA